MKAKFLIRQMNDRSPRHHHQKNNKTPKCYGMTLILILNFFWEDFIHHDLYLNAFFKLYSLSEYFGESI